MRMVPVRVVRSSALKARETKDGESPGAGASLGARLRFPAGTDLRYLQQRAAPL